MEINMGPMISCHAYFAPLNLAFGCGSAPLTNVMTAPNPGPGQPATTSGVVYLGGGLPLGIRLPLGWFSLTLGTGIDVALLSAEPGPGIIFPVKEQQLHGGRSTGEDAEIDAVRKDRCSQRIAQTRALGMVRRG